MEIYKKLNYDIQDLVLEKIFKKNVEKNKVDLLEEFKEESWIIFDKEWNKFFEETPLNFTVCLNVFPNEVLIHKPLNCEMMHLVIQISNRDICNLFHYEQDEEEHLCNIFYSTDEDIKYSDLVLIINDECNKYINFVEEEYNEDINIGDHQFLEILDLEKQHEKIQNLDVYKIDFWMGS